MKHGTLKGYKVHCCRCEDCTRANRDYVRTTRGYKHLGPGFGVARYVINPTLNPDTMTRAELMAARGYEA